MEYLDFSPYEYRECSIPMRSVGWLGRKYGVQGVDGASMADVDLKRLKAASSRLGSITLGVHDCEFCSGRSIFNGNGEYRYYVRSGEVYSAPMMILHYVEEHGYCPPKIFLEHLKDVGGLTWDWRAERLAKVLLDESVDPDFRLDAIIDLPNWRDPRVLDLLLRVAQEEVLGDLAGDEIGQSLVSLLACDFTKGLRVEDLPYFVRIGVEQALRR